MESPGASEASAVGRMFVDYMKTAVNYLCKASRRKCPRSIDNLRHLPLGFSLISLVTIMPPPRSLLRCCILVRPRAYSTAQSRPGAAPAPAPPTNGKAETTTTEAASAKATSGDFADSFKGRTRSVSQKFLSEPLSPSPPPPFLRLLFLNADSCRGQQLGDSFSVGGASFSLDDLVSRDIESNLSRPWTPLKERGVREELEENAGGRRGTPGQQQGGGRNRIGAAGDEGRDRRASSGAGGNETAATRRRTPPPPQQQPRSAFTELVDGRLEPPKGLQVKITYSLHCLNIVHSPADGSVCPSQQQERDDSLDALADSGAMAGFDSFLDATARARSGPARKTGGGPLSGGGQNRDQNRRGGPGAGGGSGRPSSPRRDQRGGGGSGKPPAWSANSNPSSSSNTTPVPRGGPLPKYAFADGFYAIDARSLFSPKKAGGNSNQNLDNEQMTVAERVQARAEANGDYTRFLAVHEEKDKEQVRYAAHVLSTNPMVPLADKRIMMEHIRKSV
jgi:hypothetical protein